MPATEQCSNCGVCHLFFGLLTIEVIGCERSEQSIEVSCWVGAAWTPEETPNNDHISPRHAEPVTAKFESALKRHEVVCLSFAPQPLR